MKNKFSKILVGIITLTMIVSSTGLAFAGEAKGGVESESVKTESGTAVIETSDFGSFNKDNAKSLSEPKSSKGISLKQATSYYDPADVTTLIDSKDETEAWFVDDIAPGNDGIVAVNVYDTGILYVDALAESASSTDTYSVFTYATYEDAVAGDNYAEWLYIDTSEVGWGYTGLPVQKGNTYYIKIENASYNDATPKITCAPYVITSASSRTLDQGSSKWTYASGKNRSGDLSTTYFKVKPNMTGVMTVTLDEMDEYASTGTVMLLNSSKKALSNSVSYNEEYKADRVYFGVKKGTTYYLKVTNCYGSSALDHGVYGIKYTMTSRTDRAIGTKSSAKKLTRYADATNTLFVASTSTSSDWYKFYVSSKRKTVVRVNAESIKSGSLTVRIYCGSKYIGKTTVYAGDINDLTITNGTTYGKANKGTYYVKVTKGTKASGKYMIRYKQ